MINGVHSLIYSNNPEADRNFFRDILKLTQVDVGDGWLIFGLPPSELAVHPAQGSDSSYELYFMCEDVELFVQQMANNNIACTPVQNRGWGLVIQLTLPGGGIMGVYQPRHARPEAMQ